MKIAGGKPICTCYFGGSRAWNFICVYTHTSRKKKSVSFYCQELSGFVMCFLKERIYEVNNKEFMLYRFSGWELKKKEERQTQNIHKYLETRKRHVPL